MTHLIWHIGLGKTASTYLQSKFPQSHSLYYIGKPFVDPKIQKIHQKCFPTCRHEYIGSKYESELHINTNAVEEYIQYLAQLASQYNKILISDECILDTLNYDMGLNIKILEKVNEQLLKLSNIDRISIYITIRNQLDWLTSVYCYTPTINGSFDNFIRNSLENNKFNFGELLDYQNLILKIGRIFTPNCELKLIPFESFREHYSKYNSLKEFFTLEDYERIFSKVDKPVNATRVSNVPIIKPREKIFFARLRRLKKEKNYNADMFINFILFLNKIYKTFLCRPKPLIVSEEARYLVIKKFSDQLEFLEKFSPDYEWKKFGY